jgi:hypothetical protein
MRRWSLAVVVAALPALAAGEDRGAATPKKAVTPEAFAAIHGGLETATSSDCLACHATEAPKVAIHNSHPVDRDYAEAAEKRPRDLRTREEVGRTGLALEGGKVGCLTCHSLSSPWKYRVRIPPGAPARRAFDRGDPDTYVAERAAAKPGDKVDTKPLCLACHAF